jgi:hypothetical protein
MTSSHKKLFLAGYHTARDGEDQDKVPVCPAFAEVGERFGGVDAALLPVGYGWQIAFSSYVAQETYFRLMFCSAWVRAPCGQICIPALELRRECSMM